MAFEIKCPMANSRTTTTLAFNLDDLHLRRQKANLCVVCERVERANEKMVGTAPKRKEMQIRPGLSEDNGVVLCAESGMTVRGMTVLNLCAESGSLRVVNPDGA